MGHPLQWAASVGSNSQLDRAVYKQPPQQVCGLSPLFKKRPTIIRSALSLHEDPTVESLMELPLNSSHFLILSTCSSRRHDVHAHSHPTACCFLIPHFKSQQLVYYCIDVVACIYMYMVPKP